MNRHMKRRLCLVSAFAVLVLVAAAVVASPAAALEEPDRLYLVGERAVADGLNALADEIQPVRLFERDSGGNSGDQDKEHEGGCEPLPALHVTFHGSTPITGGMLVAA